jgi:hypothetical protein
LHSLSSGERKGRSLNYVRVIVCRRCARGVVGADVGFCRIPSDRKRSSRTDLERSATVGESPVGERAFGRMSVS